MAEYAAGLFTALVGGLVGPDVPGARNGAEDVEIPGERDGAHYQQAHRDRRQPRKQLRLLTIAVSAPLAHDDERDRRRQRLHPRHWPLDHERQPQRDAPADAAAPAPA